MNSSSRQDNSRAPAHKTKRKRGAQQGNRNALTHGFFSAALSPGEASELQNAVSREGLDPAAAVLRAKLRTLLEHDPGNLRALDEAARLTAGLYGAMFGLDRSETACLRKVVRAMLEQHPARPAPGGPVSQNESNVP